MTRILNILLAICGIGNLVLLSVLLYTYDRWNPTLKPSQPEPATPAEYARGVGDAADCLMLLDLENNLIGQRMNWGQMKTTCEDRLGVKP